MTSLFAVRDKVSTELKHLESQEIIEQIDSSPWISNLVIAWCINREIHICVDLKEVNKAIITDKYPLPTINKLSSEFHGSTVFTKLDMRRSYLQIPLTEYSMLTAFTMHDGVYQYQRMSYGQSSAPSAFQMLFSVIYKPSNI